MGGIVPSDEDAKPTRADISFVYRSWFQEVSVRANLVDHGQLFTSHKGPQENLRITIKDAVRNMYVLKPLLERVALAGDHRLFTVSAAKDEPPSSSSIHFFFGIYAIKVLPRKRFDGFSYIRCLSSKGFSTCSTHLEILVDVFSHKMFLSQGFSFF